MRLLTFVMTLALGAMPTWPIEPTGPDPTQPSFFRLPPFVCLLPSEAEVTTQVWEVARGQMRPIPETAILITAPSGAPETVHAVPVPRYIFLRQRTASGQSCALLPDPDAPDPLPALPNPIPYVPCAAPTSTSSRGSRGSYSYTLGSVPGPLRLVEGHYLLLSADSDQRFGELARATFGTRGWTAAEWLRAFPEQSFLMVLTARTR